MATLDAFGSRSVFARSELDSVDGGLAGDSSSEWSVVCVTCSGGGIVGLGVGENINKLGPVSVLVGNHGVIGRQFNKAVDGVHKFRHADGQTRGTAYP